MLITSYDEPFITDGHTGHPPTEFCALSAYLTLKSCISAVFFARFRFSLALDFIGGKAKCPRRFQPAFKLK